VLARARSQIQQMIGGALVVPVVAAVVHLNGETAQDRTFDRSVDRGGVRNQNVLEEKRAYRNDPRERMQSPQEE